MPVNSAFARLASPVGLAFTLNANGSVRRIDHGEVLVNLFLGTEVEGSVANLYLRRPAARRPVVALLGPASGSRVQVDASGLTVRGAVDDCRYVVRLVLAADAPAWFWHVRLHNDGAAPLAADLVWTQDVGLAAYGAVRLNEYYVSQYLDHAPLDDGRHGWVVASRQNQAQAGRTPWALFGGLGTVSAFATDALQVHGFAGRAGTVPAGLADGLPSRRLQHEHAMVALQTGPMHVPPGGDAVTGFFGLVRDDHPDATSPADLAQAAAARALPEAEPGDLPLDGPGTPVVPTCFAPPDLLATTQPDPVLCDAVFGTTRRWRESGPSGAPMSWFDEAHGHVVLRDKELCVHRPHGHLLRSGATALPDETALTSTAWMSGVFHSMLTQGHVGINRVLSTVRGALGLRRADGLRVFVEAPGGWRLLDLPSAFAMRPDRCTWLYQHGDGALVVGARLIDAPPTAELTVDVVQGPPVRLLACLHLALDGDDGDLVQATSWATEGGDVVLRPAPGSALAARFPEGRVRVRPAHGGTFLRVRDDAALFADGVSRSLPFLCIETPPVTEFALHVVPELVGADADRPAASAPPLPAAPRLRLAGEGAVASRQTAAGIAATELGQLADAMPWFVHDAAIHHLAPRGLEQFSGGGWGVRDVCQGPAELLLALDCPAAVRDLLLRVFRAQNPDGDWPQWFMFFPREAAIRAPDAHGDIVFWPLLALARYLLASGDAALLDAPLPFHGEDRAVPLDGHVQRALDVIAARVIPGTQLAAYGHGDWNDALQPADPALRDRLCSAWTVTLHHQTLRLLADALERVGRPARVPALRAQAEAVRADFQRLLVVDGVVAGYALFEADGAPPALLLHPRDARTGLRYSLLPMIHAIIDDLFTPEQASAHLRLIADHLTGPDGARLFDRPLPYRGGPQRLFQRAESAAFFGREIGLMYTHAHLRYAEALARVGHGAGFLRALSLAHPIGLAHRVARATPRQANCYSSSSDAAFPDRYAAFEDYAAVNEGRIALDGGWRVYSSGPGIAVGLFVRHLLGLAREADALVIDPVIDPALDGLSADVGLLGTRFAVRYALGPRGCGVQEVRLNGRTLPFSRRDNAYRAGAAVVPLADLRAAMRGRDERLEISLG